MDSLSRVINLVKKGDWAISLDLKDAYMHIPIFPSHKRFLRFCIKGKCYQFTCLCFGPTIAPRVFTKVIFVVAAHLRMRNIRLAVYLDDWLFVNLIRRLLLIDREKALNLLSKLGFMINLEKSALEPSQSVVYIIFTRKRNSVPNSGESNKNQRSLSEPEGRLLSSGLP